MRTKAWLILLTALGVLFALALAWRYTGLADWGSVARVARLLGEQRHEPWVAAAVIGVFLLSGVVLLPMNIVVLATEIRRAHV